MGKKEPLKWYDFRLRPLLAFLLGWREDGSVPPTGLRRFWRPAIYGSLARAAAAFMLVVALFTGGAPLLPVACVLFIVGCGTVAGLVCVLWAWTSGRIRGARGAKPHAARWLILGVCDAILIGHWLAAFAIRRGYYWEGILGAMLIIIPIGTVAGVFAGAAMERSHAETGRPSMLRCWIVLFALAIIQFFMVLPILQGVRE